MGRLYILYIQRTEAEFYGRHLSDFSTGRADLFFEIAKLLERKLNQPCGITDYSYMDEYGVEPEAFILFFERFMSQEWQGIGVEHLHNWAAQAAGMIVNITLEYRIWKTPDGKVLPAQRYMLSEGLEALLDEKQNDFEVEVRDLPPVVGARENRFDYLPLEAYARIIADAQLP